MKIHKTHSVVVIFSICAFVLVCESSGDEKTDTTTDVDINEGGDDLSNIGEVNCDHLLPGQYLCNELASIDPATQQPAGCQKETERARITCEAGSGISCKESGNRNFTREIPCKWTNGYDFDTALLLSIFLGFFGADRFYLGYPAIGVLKFSTLGFFFLGHLLDIILIASQVVGPADGSHYIVSYFGPALNIIGINDETIRKPQPDWF